MKLIIKKPLNASIVKEHKGFIVFGQNDYDIEIKINKINKGDTKGFYKINDIIEIVQ